MAKNRSEVPVEDRWNVEALYPDAQVWSGRIGGGRGEGRRTEMARICGFIKAVLTNPAGRRRPF